jgi:hypothetical protein
MPRGVNMDHDVAKSIEFIDKMIADFCAERERLLRKLKLNTNDEKAFSSLARGILASGFNRVSSQSSNWAGSFVLDAIDKDADGQEGRDIAAEMLRRMVAAGYLSIGSEYSPRRGRKLPVYEAGNALPTHDFTGGNRWDEWEKSMLPPPLLPL